MRPCVRTAVLVAVALALAATPAGASTIYATSWTLVSARTHGGTVLTPRPEIAPTFRLSRSGALDAFGGCNQGGGTGRARRGVLRTHRVGFFRKGCLPAVQRLETVFAAVLRSTSRYRVHAGRLTLRSHAGRLVFER